MNHHLLKSLATLCVAAGFGFSAPAQPPLYRLAQSVALGGGIKWDYLDFDPSSDRVYISHGDEVTVVDGKTGKRIGALTELPGSHGIAVDPESGLIYADSAGRSVVMAFNPKTLRPVASAPVLPDADGINYDPFSHQMFVSGGDGDGLTPVSTITGKAAATIALGTSPEFHVADGAGAEYVDLVAANAIARIDTRTNTVTARWPIGPCQHPKGIAVDRVTSRLFVSCSNGNAVLLDARTGKVVATVPIGKGTDAADFDPAQKRFFSANGDGTLTVVKENSPSDFIVLTNLKTALGARTMAVDPVTGRIYLVTATVVKTIEPADPSDHPHYVFAPGSLKLLIFAPATP